MNLSVVDNFSVIFISIILEAIPFILLGALISACIQIFVSEELVAKIIPKNKLLGFIGAALMGVVFPVCECAIIPITKRLIKKGVPVGIATTFMLAVPIVNPVVLMSTYYAFYQKPSMVILRGGFGLIAAIMVGLFINIINNKNLSFIKENAYNSEYLCACGCNHQQGINNSKIKSILEHTSKELLDISKYLIFGAFLSSIFQTMVSKSYIISIGNHSLYSVLVMMLLAFTLSLCSEADAFIARTFLNQFSLGSIVAFLILGPMIDIKNTMMLMGNFKGKLVIQLITYIILVTIFIGLIVNIMQGFGVV